MAVMPQTAGSNTGQLSLSKPVECNSICTIDPAPIPLFPEEKEEKKAAAAAVLAWFWNSVPKQRPMTSVMSRRVVL